MIALCIETVILVFITGGLWHNTILSVEDLEPLPIITGNGLLSLVLTIATIYSFSLF
jgi:hypothetical protein